MTVLSACTVVLVLVLTLVVLFNDFSLDDELNELNCSLKVSRTNLFTVFPKGKTVKTSSNVIFPSGKLDLILPEIQFHTLNSIC